MFPFRTSFSGVFNKIFIEVPYFHKPLSPVFLKILWLYICTQALVFLENTVLNVWQCSGYVAVLVTVEWFIQSHYAICCIWQIQNSSMFSTLFFQVYVRIFSHIQCYWDIFMHIEVYSGLFRHIQHRV